MYDYQISSILREATAPHHFPTFCGILIGGSTLLQAPIQALTLLLLRTLQRPIDVRLSRRFARFIAALVSAALSFTLLNKPPASSRPRRSFAVPYPSTHLKFVQPGPFDEPPELHILEPNDAMLSVKSVSRKDLAGRTMDLTLFSVIRAIDIIISTGWERLPSRASSKLNFVPQNTPSTLFCFSAATIMHAWFYSPSRLPQTYNRWISAAAELDHRLLLALRHARYGTWIYGKDTGMSPLLGSLCQDYGCPEEWGDPAKTIPIPCEVVHMGRGKNCEKHALWRFYRGWLFAARMYAPLQLIVLARHMKTRAVPGSKFRFSLPIPVVLGALADMARSSAFLGAFIAFFYYGVCLSRTRLGPKLFSYKTITPQMWDSGLCTLFGCLLCGSSILIEQSRKRFEILFFVLPRAAATWFPRRYLPENRWKEHIAFSLSAALVLTVAQDNPKRVRGVLGSVLNSVLRTD